MDTEFIKKDMEAEERKDKERKEEERKKEELMENMVEVDDRLRNGENNNNQLNVEDIIEEYTRR